MLDVNILLLWELTFFLSVSSAFDLTRMGELTVGEGDIRITFFACRGRIV